MREGAWVNAHTGVWSWIDEHARWIQDSSNAERIGLGAEAFERIRSVRRDFNGPGRRMILRHAMEAGLVRFRGHGTQYTFESRLTVIDTVDSIAAFMACHCGPRTFCRVTDLARGLMLEAFYEDVHEAVQDPFRLKSVTAPDDEGSGA